MLDRSVRIECGDPAIDDRGDAALAPRPDGQTVEELIAGQRAAGAGPARAAKKFGEEAVELVIAAVEGETGAIRSEAADVLYHLMVVLRTRGIELQDVLKELETRTTRSGHEEKASRKA
eukprot:gene30767-34971_t